MDSTYLFWTEKPKGEKKKMYFLHFNVVSTLLSVMFNELY